MTAEIVDVPPRPGPPRPAAPAAGPPATGAGLWPAAARRAALVPLVVLLPLVTLTPAADHRFNVYANGALYAADPARLLRTVATSVPMYLARGNFRPLGRLVEWSLDTAAYAGTALFGLPANITLRLVSFAAAMLLTLAAVVFAESVTARGRLLAGPPSVLAATVPFAVAAGLVAAGRTSTTVLFGGLYFVSAALVLTVTAWACRTVRPRAGAVVAAGAALAAFNEIAYLAVPLATAAVLLRGRVVLGLSWRATLRAPGARFAALLWLGFLPVFVPVRWLIYRRCASGGCYTGSDIAVPGAAGALPNRLVSWLPPLMWHRAAGGGWPHLSGVLPILALLALALLAWRAGRQLPRLSPLDRRQALALAGVAAVLLLLAGGLAALNADVQAFAAAGRWGQGWRDSGLTTVAGGVLTLALLSARRTAAAATLALLVFAGTVSATANRDYRDASAGGRYPYLHDRIAQEVADFDRTPAGDARRCALRADFIATSVANHGGTSAELERFDVSLDRAARQLAGRRFCGAAPR